MMKTIGDKTYRTNGPIHEHFGLSYSSYAVLPRTLMQSMPVEWQARMVACLKEMDAAFAHIEQAPCYDVTAAAEIYVEDLDPELTDADLLALGLVRSGAAPSGYRDRDGNDLDADARVLLPLRFGDPVPHYNRGRTFIEPTS